LTWVDVVSRANEELDEIGLDSFSGEVIEADRGRMDRPFLVKDNSVLVRDMEQDFGIALRDLAAHEMTADIMSDRAGLPSPDTRTSADATEFVELYGKLDEGESSAYAPGDESRKKENVCLLMREKGEEMRRIQAIADDAFNQLDFESSKILREYVDDDFTEDYFDTVPDFWGYFVADFTGAQTRRRHYEEHLDDIGRLIEYEGTNEKGRKNFLELKGKMPELREIDMTRFYAYELAKKSIEIEFANMVDAADSELLAASIFYRDAGHAGLNPIYNPDEYCEEVESIEYVNEEVYKHIEQMVSDAVRNKLGDSRDLEEAYKETVRTHLN